MGILTVTKISEGPVRPSGATPAETLPLGWIDRYPTHRGLVESVHVYREAAAPRAPAAAIIREALAEALVHYYPLAGRIVEAAPGEPAVLCSGDGVYFVEAAANCSLADVKFLERPLMLAKEQLVPYPATEDWAVEPHNTIAMMQVTTFTCGGLVVGLRTNHAVADGMGAAQFLNAVGELARGLPAPRVNPVWGRDRMPDPAIKPGPLPDLPVLALDYLAFYFPAAYLDKLKSQYASCSGGGKPCSAFDVVVAKMWQCRTRAIRAGSDSNSDVNLCFFASVRHVLRLEPGAYGNAIFPVKMSAPGARIAGSSVVEIVGLVREAKRRMAEECLKWAEGRASRDPFQMEFSYDSVYVSDWSKLGFSEVDYGFGTPTVAGPLVNCDLIASAIVMKAPAPLAGTRLLASCVTKEHSAEFERFMREDLLG